MGLTEYSFGETNLWNVFWTHLTPKPAAKRSFPRNHGGSRIAWSRERKHDSASRLVPQREAPFILRGLGPPAHVRRGEVETCLICSSSSCSYKRGSELKQRHIKSTPQLSCINHKKDHFKLGLSNMKIDPHKNVRQNGSGT